MDAEDPDVVAPKQATVVLSEELASTLSRMAVAPDLGAFLKAAARTARFEALLLS